MRPVGEINGRGKRKKERRERDVVGKVGIGKREIIYEGKKEGGRRVGLELV